MQIQRFFLNQESSSTPKTKTNAPYTEDFHPLQRGKYFSQDPVMMVLISMSFLFDKTKIQVLGLFILTPASVALKNSEKQKGRSQFTRHKLLFLVLNLIPDVRTNTLSTAIQIFSSSGKFRDFY